VTSWLLALLGPAEAREVFIGYGQGTTIGVLVITAGPRV
jgi:hypothetical protein